MDEWEKYELHHRKRLAIKPGLTGMWQVSGRSDITDFEEVVELDTKYIAEWCLKLDNIVYCFWKEDFVKKLQSFAGKADMFVERSRNKSIDKKSVLCYSESTNHVAIGIFVCDFSH